jgi:activator of 2-hydroxyglutaryl-CoA dehydratase
MISIGVDIGSTATKAAVLCDGQISKTLVIPTGFSGTDAAERVAADLLQSGYDMRELPVVATGYGRVSVPYAQRTVTEITCHGKGAAPGLRGGGRGRTGYQGYAGCEWSRSQVRYER